MLRTIRHQIWTDTRGLSLYLTAWIVVLAIQVGVVAAGPAYVPEAPQRFTLDVAAMVMRALMTVVLTVLVIQRDSAIGTTAFWRTRPITPVGMWASKAAWIVLWVVLLPAAAIGAVWLALGLGPSGSLYGAALVAVDQATMAGIAMMAAAVTATVAHFVVAIAAGFAVYMGLMTTLSRLVPRWPRWISADGGYGAGAMLAMVLFTGGLLVLATQYVSRRVAQSAGIGVLALVAATLGMISVEFVIPWPPLPRVPVNRALLDPDRISLSVVPLSIREQPQAAVMGSREPRKLVYGSLDVAGAPPYAVFETLGVRSILRVPGTPGISWKMPNPRWGRVSSLFHQATEADQPYRSLRAALDGPELVVPAGTRGSTPYVELASIPDAQFGSLTQAVASIDAEVTLRAYREVAVASVPLQPGQSVYVEGRRWTLLAVDRIPGGLTVTMRGPGVESFRRSFPADRVHLVLRNRDKRQAIVLARSRSRAFAANFSMWTDRAVHEVERHDFVPGPDVVRRLGIDARWIDGAELVWLKPEELGTITRPLTLPAFTLGAPPRTQPPG